MRLNRSILRQHLHGRSYVFFNEIWLQNYEWKRGKMSRVSIGGRIVYPQSSAFYQGCVCRRRWRALCFCVSGTYDSCLLIVSHLYLFIITRIIYLCTASFFFIHCGSSVESCSLIKRWWEQAHMWLKRGKKTRNDCWYTSINLTDLTSK